MWHPVGFSNEHDKQETFHPPVLAVNTEKTELDGAHKGFNGREPKVTAHKIMETEKPRTQKKKQKH